MILIIDNYDSFTFNLVQYIRQLDREVTVRRNNEITIEEIKQLKPSHILLSPGPGNPDGAGICLEVVNQFYKDIPILGVCLGHQIIAQAFGGNVIKASQPMHGKISSIKHDVQGIFHNLTNPLNVTRYHSLIVDASTLPSCLTITAQTQQGEIMALRHKEYKIEGIQAHPEAILTENGLQLLDNFFNDRGNSV
ncbi:aminodeoxychorismate/anthranilate synthase component II [Ornithinibacillus sp. L9]|uniref:Aminodeoxychorismate/anthranilate synthase component II n=1 Tax=Ornithinibacillus caprae TaxID=2678566 RepID=A0A6N8FF41_9BACI|nr:aminodeoxychorismate/anthranilate synthase component II [Ornithinibacillus caprae]MUK88312.1 aminodeoxychorismate/anthranilate synthase component II [Ornithinibacillus caprae]